MLQNEEERSREMRKTHQELLRRWKKEDGPCIICGERSASERDHLPPKVLYPASARSDKTEFFTFPVCSSCNRYSSDEDFLFSLVLSLGLNRESVLRNDEPTDPDLAALYQQALEHFKDTKEASRRASLLTPYLSTDPRTGMRAINGRAIPLNQTLTKIAKSIYWLYTDGDIIERYKPGWWIRSHIDTTKPMFIEKHLLASHAVFQWEDKFIARFNFGRREDGVGGLLLSSLHFYTKRELGAGMSWYVWASPTATKAEDKSYFDHCSEIWGPATVAPRKLS